MSELGERVAEAIAKVLYPERIPDEGDYQMADAALTAISAHIEARDGNALTQARIAQQEHVSIYQRDGGWLCYCAAPFDTPGAAEDHRVRAGLYAALGALGLPVPASQHQEER